MSKAQPDPERRRARRQYAAAALVGLGAVALVLAWAWHQEAAGPFGPRESVPLDRFFQYAVPVGEDVYVVETDPTAERFGWQLVRIETDPPSRHVVASGDGPPPEPDGAGNDGDPLALAGNRLLDLRNGTMQPIPDDVQFAPDLLRGRELFGVQSTTVSVRSLDTGATASYASPARIPGEGHHAPRVVAASSNRLLLRQSDAEGESRFWLLDRGTGNWTEIALEAKGVVPQGLSPSSIHLADDLLVAPLLDPSGALWLRAWNPALAQEVWEVPLGRHARDAAPQVFLYVSGTRWGVTVHDGPFGSNGAAAYWGQAGRLEGSIGGTSQSDAPQRVVPMDGRLVVLRFESVTVAQPDAAVASWAWLPFLPGAALLLGGAAWGAVATLGGRSRSSNSGRTCAKCGTASAQDEAFCRHCGELRP